MKIKKRGTVIVSNDASSHEGDVMAKKVDFSSFEAKPKKPMPAPAILPMHGENATPGTLRRTGLIAQDAGRTADADMNVADRLTLLRTPFDANDAQEVRYRNRVRNRATAITALCITCTGGRKQVTECADVTCPLWAFRLGGNPFRRRT